MEMLCNVIEDFNDVEAEEQPLLGDGEHIPLY